jgi:hypothetical protein
MKHPGQKGTMVRAIASRCFSVRRFDQHPLLS